MLDVIIDGLLDTLKVIPFLFAAFLLLEYIEHKYSAKTHRIIKKAGRLGPVIGSALGAFPQCGFSAMASNLYATRIITLGTLIAVYLSTSDEMLLIMLSRPDTIGKGLIIVLIKVIIGIIVGFVIDLIMHLRHREDDENIKDFCEMEHCHCEHGIFRSAIKHTLKIALFILIVNLVLGIAIHYLGEDNFSKIMLKDTLFAPFIASLVGLIPNCAASVAITELYISGAISFGSVLSGLLTSCGVGVLILFRVNRPMKQNVAILAVLYLIGAFSGLIVDLIGIAI